MTKKRLSQLSEDYRRIEQAIKFIEANFKSRPDLDEIAKSINLSKYHFHRLFKRWAGISPVRFMQFLTLEYAKEKLAESGNLLDASLDTGLSGPGRLHDLFVTFDAMTPGEYKQYGTGLRIEYGHHHTIFGECLIAKTDRGICHLGFLDSINKTKSLNHLQNLWPNAIFAENSKATESIVENIFRPETTNKKNEFRLLLKGTNFQVNVWRALLTIPEGSLVSYQDIAAIIGQPNAVRAVGHAVAVNPVAYLIPCHRVIAKTGIIYRYRWGSSRKKAILGWEAARAGMDALS